MVNSGPEHESEITGGVSMGVAETAARADYGLRASSVNGASPATGATGIAGARAQYWTVVGSHFVVDLYPMFLVALVAALQDRLSLTEMQAALIISLNGIVSGLSQPVFAWIGDRRNTRLFGALGLAVGALAISAIGWATNYWQLVALQIVGMAGVGIFHPVSSALAGRLGAGALSRTVSGKSARGMGLAIFFAAGVGAGGFIGPIVATRINATGPDGIRLLSFMAVPGLVMAVWLWLATRHVAHRDESSMSRADGALSAVATERARWAAVALLFVSNTLRFTTNLGLFYLYKRWAEAQLGGEASAAGIASLHGEALAASQIGMGVSAIMFGRYLAHGRERRAMIIAGFATAPVIALMPFLDGWMFLPAAFLAAFGFFGVIPTSLALAQRLLPHATGMTGSILMGCGWAISSTGPILGERVANAWGLPAAFFTLAGLMALAGGVSALVSRRLIRAAAALA